MPYDGVALWGAARACSVEVPAEVPLLVIGEAGLPRDGALLLVPKRGAQRLLQGSRSQAVLAGRACVEGREVAPGLVVDPQGQGGRPHPGAHTGGWLFSPSDAADERSRGALGGRRILQKNKSADK